MKCNKKNTFRTKECRQQGLACYLSIYSTILSGTERGFKNKDVFIDLIEENTYKNRKEAKEELLDWKYV